MLTWASVIGVDTTGRRPSSKVAERRKRRSPVPGARRFLADGDLVELPIWPGPPGHSGCVAEEGDGAEHFRLRVGRHGPGVLVLSAGHERHQGILAFRLSAKVPADEHVVNGLLAGVHHVGDHYWLQLPSSYRPLRLGDAGVGVQALLMNEDAGCLCPPTLLGLALALVEGLAEFLRLQRCHLGLLLVDLALVVELLTLDVELSCLNFEQFALLTSSSGLFSTPGSQL